VNYSSLSLRYRQELGNYFAMSHVFVFASACSPARAALFETVRNGSASCTIRDEGLQKIPLALFQLRSQFDCNARCCLLCNSPHLVIPEKSSLALGREASARAVPFKIYNAPKIFSVAIVFPE
jgi:hypothetical protein